MIKKGLFKYFIGYVINYIKLLCMTLSQMDEYVKYFNDNKCMNLLVHDKEFPKIFNAVWDKISILLKKGVDSELVHSGKYIKTKIKIYNNKIIQTFMVTKYLKITNFVLVYL